MKQILLILLLTPLVLWGCNAPSQLPTPIQLPTLALPTFTPLPTATATLPPTATLFPPPTATIPPTATPAPSPTSIPFCSNPAVLNLINAFKTAIIQSDGVTLSQLVSPTHGMDVRIFRNGNVINYDQQHAKFVFVSTFQANWGNAPASGEPIQGSFSNVVLPELLKVFTQPYSLHCNQLQHGGATYTPAWPYPGQDFYSAYYAGTSTNGYLDWYTWAIGIEFVGGKPYIFALVPFFWEP